MVLCPGAIEAHRAPVFEGSVGDLRGQNRGGGRRGGGAIKLSAPTVVTVGCRCGTPPLEAEQEPRRQATTTKFTPPIASRSLPENYRSFYVGTTNNTYLANNVERLTPRIAGRPLRKPAVHQLADRPVEAPAAEGQPQRPPRRLEDGVPEPRGSAGESRFVLTPGPQQHFG